MCAAMETGGFSPAGCELRAVPEEREGFVCRCGVRGEHRNGEKRQGGSGEGREWVRKGRQRGEGGADGVREGSGCTGMAEEEEEGV